MYVETISTPSLGNRGYLVHDGKYAAAIDVQRDYGRWQHLAEEKGVIITHVLETHVHNDYVTGGYRLAQRLKAEYGVPTGSEVAFSARYLADKDIISVGKMKIEALHTPGHTEHHLSFLCSSEGDTALFSGGGLLYGTVGRTDLISEAKTRELTELQYDSAQRVSRIAPEETRLYPTHGFGSFCSSADGSGADEGTLATEKQLNPVFSVKRDTFVKQILDGLGPYPRYYIHMAPINREGPVDVAPLHFHDYDPQTIVEHLDAPNRWVVDVRQRTVFSTGHPQGAVGFEMGDSFATYLGWIIPWTDHIILVGDDESVLRDAYTELSRIGMETHIIGATHDMSTYMDAGVLSSYPRKTFKDLKAEPQGATPFVLDVRLPSDWSEEHVRGSRNIPLHELIGRMEEVPADHDVWVHCASGYRASIAASLLDKFGRSPVLIDDVFEHAGTYQLTEGGVQAS